MHPLALALLLACGATCPGLAATAVDAGQTDRLTAAIVLGVLVATVAILAFLWRAVRDPALAYLIGLTGLLAFYVAASGRLLPAELPEPLMQAAVAVLFACGLAFAARFFELERVAPRFGRFVDGLAFGWLMVAPLAIAGLPGYSRLLQIATLITVVVFLGVGVYACARRLPGCWIFLAAWTMAGFAAAARAAAFAGWLGDSLAATRAPLHVGAALAAILMALAGANRVRAQREASEAALRQSRERFALAARGANDGLFDWDIASESVWCSGRLHDLLGLPDGALNGSPQDFLSLIEDQAAVEHEMRGNFARQRRKFQREFRMRHADGRHRWMLVSGMILYGDSGDPSRLVGSLRDVTDRKAAEDAVKESESRYALAVRGNAEGIYDFDLRNRTIYFSDRHAEIAGVTCEELGTRWDSFLRFAIPEDRPKLAGAVRKLLAQPDRTMGLEYRIRRADGEERWVFTNGAVQRGPDGRAIRIAGSTSDITERKRAQDKVLHDALHDRLTDLANRALFTDHLIQDFARPDGGFAVVMLNLDRFRQVNDDLGHQAGDDLLKEIADRLRRFIKPGDTVARFGGDEFALIVHGLESADAAEATAGELRAALHAPAMILGQKLFPSVSIGLTLGPEGYARGEDMIADATLAMYRAKGGGRGRWWLFRRGTRSRAPGRVALETDLHHAIERGELLLHHQPIVALADMSLAGFEALLRWRHPTRGMIPPGSFIAMAEETGLIVPIGRWALGEAARCIARWRQLAPHTPPGFVSVNVSARQFLNHDVIGDVREAIESTGIDPQWLKLEVTESLIMTNPDLAQEALQALQRLGVILSIDDFGTGYSSLSYLHRFPFRMLKIDRSFVAAMHDSNESMVIVRAIASLAHSLDMTVVAEGIETAGEAAALQALSCEYGQGYFFAKPMDNAGADAMAAANRRWSLAEVAAG